DVRTGQAGPLGFADRPHRGLALLGVEPVDEQHTVEMVDLVLDATREQRASLNGDRVAVHVEPTGDDALASLGREREAGKGQAALVAVLLLVAHDADYRVDQVTDSL